MVGTSGKVGARALLATASARVLPALICGAGNDRFVFNTALNAATNRDTITDFSPGSDKLLLDDAVFTQLVVGNLADGNLASSPGGTAGDSNDFLLYNTTTGTLSYDADGNGGAPAVQFAILTGNPAITSADFAVF